ncbi:hypothetical protein HMPREF9946_02546 [Acetobacteraceae bacterium AT-5844]|nr:hypothetical protein HMPREF9946_02546 [Acetobacteraceae bacterium AT-5844]
MWLLCFRLSHAGAPGLGTARAGRGCSFPEKKGGTGDAARPGASQYDGAGLWSRR